MQPKPLVLLGAVLASTAALSAQSLTSPAGLTGTEGNTTFYHWGSTALSRRFQSIDATHVGSQFTIKSLAWRRNGGGSSGGVARSLDLEVKLAEVDFALLSDEFDRNYNLAPATVVFTKKTVNLPDWTTSISSPEPFDFIAKLDTQFPYGGKNALCIDFFYDNTTSTQLAQTDRDYVGALTRAGASIGTGCVSSGGAAPYTLAMRAENNGPLLGNYAMRFRFSATGAPANSPVFVNLDFADPNLMVPGLCTTLHALPTISVDIGATDGTGTLPNTYLSFPYAAGLQGASIYAQALSIDPGMTPLPVSISNGATAAMPNPASSQHAALYHWATGTAPAGASLFGGTMVIELGL